MLLLFIYFYYSVGLAQRVILWIITIPLNIEDFTSIKPLEDAVFRRLQRIHYSKIWIYYNNIAIDATLKYNDIMNLLHCISPVHYNYTGELRNIIRM